MPGHACLCLLVFICDLARQHYYHQQQHSFLAVCITYVLKACVLAVSGKVTGFRVVARNYVVSALSAAGNNLVTCLQNKQQKYCVNV